MITGITSTGLQLQTLAMASDFGYQLLATTSCYQLMSWTIDFRKTKLHPERIPEFYSASQGKCGNLGPVNTVNEFLELSQV